MSNISEAMKAAVGTVTARTTSYPISESDIRKWALAVYWPDKPPAYFIDPAEAAKTVHGGIVAPEDFNPFAWASAGHESLITNSLRAGTNDPDSTEKSLGIEGPGLTFMLNGGMVCEYGVRMRAGDVITSEASVGEYSEREGRLGLMLFSRSISTWTNQKGEMVKRTTGTLIRY
ncbi:MAG: MaoC family dehydratase N-terminal domain-containing protein [Candidatus Nanopelagicales bacterium]|nr:MaoC family dehydratase N-terminal domain-containing protein [Candidatus Nanopelagicales bacterium]